MPYITPTAIDRQQAIAQALRGKKMGKHGAGGRTHWADGLAYIVDQIYAGKISNKANEQEKANTALQSKELAAAIAGKQGLGGLPEQQVDTGGDMQVFAGGQAPTPFQTPQAQQIHAQNAAALRARDQSLEDMATKFGYDQRLQQSAPYTLPPQAQRYGGPPVDGESPMIAENTNQYSRGAGGGTQARVRRVDTVEHGIVNHFPDGTYKTLDGNIITGHITPRNTDPELQGEIAGARKGAQLQAGRSFSMEGARPNLIRARELLTGETADGQPLQGWEEPTGSGVGAAYDAAAGFFGHTPDGAEESGALETIGGWLVSNVPRMEGPQSDFDVKNYRIMAARIGDPTVPLDRRIAALDELETIMARYAHLNQGDSDIEGILSQYD